ncbi:hypothetical protein C8R48DRAFT_818734 [Suillus tomentosus]|nr:hypothetical protein C8R48DRAFT_818734 [Suillus tomentosus]
MAAPVIPSSFQIYNSYVEDPKWQIKFTIIWCSGLALAVAVSVPSLRGGPAFHARATHPLGVSSRFTMASEESPLLALAAHEAIYNRFAPHQKMSILFHVSFAGLLAMFVQVTFVPSIPRIAKDLDLTDAVVSIVAATLCQHMIDD